MAKWIVDTTHSEVQFKVKHLVISTVTGTFNKFYAELEAEKDDFTDAKIAFSADIDSIDTNNAQRDAHLKSDDFFNAEKFPQMTFKSSSLEKSNGKYALKGDLTIRDITKPVELEVEFGGVATDPYGQIKAGFEAVGKINRKEFGLMWSAITEAGGVVVSDEVKILLNVQFIKQG
jgi:polyisoprenoid-binding protein YceI